MIVPVAAKLRVRHWVRIRYLDEILDDDGKTEIWGDSDTQKRLIRISTTMNRCFEEVLDTFRHEMKHYMLDLNGHSAWLGKDREEGIVLGLENDESGFFVIDPRAPIRWADIEFPWED